MQFRSTKQSVRELKPTVLAILETLLACSVTIALAVIFDSVVHIASGALIAPFMLLRTDRSTNLGWAMWKRIVGGFVRGSGWLDSKVHRSIGAIAMMLGALLLGPCAVLARFSATFVVFFANPVQSFGAAPDNWRRAVLALDSFTSPDAVPSPDTLVGAKDIYAHETSNVYALLADVTSNERGLRWVSSLIYGLLLGSPIIVPAIVYRISLKSTAMLWFPLLWACKSLGKAADSLGTRVSLFLHSDLQRIARTVSFASIIMFAVKVAVLMARFGPSEALSQATAWLPRGTPLGELLEDLVAPGEIPMWQAATFVSSLLCIGQWLWLRSVARHLEAKAAVDEGSVDRAFMSTQFFRRVLMFYTWSCTLYMAARIAFDVEWPHLGTKLFPWSDD